MLWIGGLGGLLFSILFAWHLTRPMNALRRSFDRVARGDLGVRLWPALRWRRDELTEVAKEFDLMVERLQQLVEGREQLLHDVSHELRSPLARLQAAIGLMRQDPSRLEASIERIERETGRVDELVGQLLTLARLEAGSRDMHEEPQIPNYGEPGRGPLLEEGMVLAIEPMVMVTTNALLSRRAWKLLSRE